MQKTYWATHCHKIGYAPRRNKSALANDGGFYDKVPSMSGSKRSSSSNEKLQAPGKTHTDRHRSNMNLRNKASGQKGVQLDLSSASSEEDDNSEDVQATNTRVITNGYSPKLPSSSKFTKNGSKRVMHSPPGLSDIEADTTVSGGRVRRSTTSRANMIT